MTAGGRAVLLAAAWRSAQALLLLMHPAMVVAWISSGQLARAHVMTDSQEQPQHSICWMPATQLVDGLMS